MNSPEPPRAAAFVADSGWRAIELISDIHLREDRKATFAAWRAHLLGTDADALLILGDLFEAWIGDDARGEGFEAECVDVLRQAAALRRIGFMAGNRDFLVGQAMLDETGVMRLADPTLLFAWQHRVLLTHGDALCVADTEYQRFRTAVRSPAWQADFLARPLPQRRALARQMRDASTMRQAAMDSAVDVDDELAARWIRGANASAMVHGHTHRPGRRVLPGGCARHVLGDWEFDAQPRRAQALRLTPQGLKRVDLSR